MPQARGSVRPSRVSDKYPVASHQVAKKIPRTRKHGHESRCRAHDQFLNSTQTWFHRSSKDFEHQLNFTDEIGYTLVYAPALLVMDSLPDPRGPPCHSAAASHASPGHQVRLTFLSGSGANLRPLPSAERHRLRSALDRLFDRAENPCDIFYVGKMDGTT